MYSGPSSSCSSGTMSRSRNGGNGKEGSKSPRTEVDRLSSLPDSLLLHILSFLPTRDAVATALVPPFRGLWKHLRDLSFSQCHFHLCRDDQWKDDPRCNEAFLRVVEHVLTRLESPAIYSFYLCMNFYISSFLDDDRRHGPIFDVFVAEEQRMAERLDKFVCFVLEKKVKVLDLVLRAGELSGYHRYRLPSTVLCVDSLVELALDGCSIKPKGPIRLKSLRKLSLWRVRLRDKTVADMISASPLLKELTLDSCSGLRILTVGWHPSLETLDVTCLRGLKKVDLELSCIKSLTIYVGPCLRDVVCPNVTALSMTGSIEDINLSDASSVIDMSLDFPCGFKGESKEHRKFKTLLEKFCSSAHFELCHWCILVFTMWELINQPCPSLNWKYGTVTLYLTKWHLPGISFLLRACNHLEMLSIYVYPSTRSNFQPSDEEWTQERDFEGENYWKSVDTFACLEHHLRSVMIYGNVTEPYVLEVIGFLLGRALILERMVISTETAYPESNLTADKLQQLSVKVLSFPRASACAAVQVVT